MNVGKHLNEIRRCKNISIYRLSIDSEVSESHIRNIENGTKNVTVETLQMLLKPLNITLPEFFKEDENIFYLTPNEKLLLKYFRSLPVETENAVLEFCKRMHEQFTCTE